MVKIFCKISSIYHPGAYEVCFSSSRGGSLVRKVVHFHRFYWVYFMDLSLNKLTYTWHMMTFSVLE